MKPDTTKKTSTPANPLVGRREESQRALQLLSHRNVRLLTLVGAGGAIAALLGYCAVSGNRLVRVVSLIWLSSVVTGKLLGWGDGFTAYWALLGGFAAGCVLEALPKRFIPAH